MRLADGTGVELALRIIGYQFPELEQDGDDSNWLMIEIRAAHPRGRWRRLDPALLTYEAEALARWLDQLAAGSADEDCWFTEPCLELHRIGSPSGGSVRLRVHLSHEFAPPWADVFSGEDLVFELSMLDLNAAAESLRVQLARFPSRAPTP